MRLHPVRFVLIATGAFICWAFKGFKGKLNDEMVGPFDKTFKTDRNLLLGVLAILIVLLFIGSL